MKHLIQENDINQCKGRIHTIRRGNGIVNTGENYNIHFN